MNTPPDMSATDLEPGACLHDLASSIEAARQDGSSEGVAVLCGLWEQISWPAVLDAIPFSEVQAATALVKDARIAAEMLGAVTRDAVKILNSEQVPYWLLANQFRDGALLIALEHGLHVAVRIRDFLKADPHNMTAH